MPNHVHGAIVIENQDEKREIAEMKFKPEKRSLSIVVRNFKSAVSIRSREQYANLAIKILR